MGTLSNEDFVTFSGKCRRDLDEKGPISPKNVCYDHKPLILAEEFIGHILIDGTQKTYDTLRIYIERFS